MTFFITIFLLPFPPSLLHPSIHPSMPSSSLLLYRLAGGTGSRSLAPSFTPRTHCSLLQHSCPGPSIEASVNLPFSMSVRVCVCHRELEFLKDQEVFSFSYFLIVKKLAAQLPPKSSMLAAFFTMLSPLFVKRHGRNQEVAPKKQTSTAL